MRTKDITDCFEIGRLEGFSITIRIIQSLCVPIADIWHGAWAIGKEHGRAAGGSLKGKTAPAATPPHPRGGGKTGGVFLGRVGYISQPFKTTSSEQGGVQEKQGGMIFEQVCKK